MTSSLPKEEGVGAANGRRILEAPPPPTQEGGITVPLRSILLQASCLKGPAWHGDLTNLRWYLSPDCCVSNSNSVRTTECKIEVYICSSSKRFSLHAYFFAYWGMLTIRNSLMIYERYRSTKKIIRGECYR